jgi:regulatory protein
MDDDDTGNPVEHARAAAVRMLARRELSAAQVRERLIRRGHAAGAVEDALARLREAGFVDDGRVARAFARTRALVKRHGRERVLRELHAMGIEREIARMAIDDVFASVDERELLETALERRLRPRMALEDPAVQRRLYAALVRQGFGAEAVARAIRARLRHARELKTDD